MLQSLRRDLDNQSSLPLTCLEPVGFSISQGCNIPSKSYWKQPSALSLPARRAEEKARVVGMSAFLADYLHPRLGGNGPQVGRWRRCRGRIWDEDTDYRGDDSSDEYYSTEDEVDYVGYAGKNVA